MALPVYARQIALVRVLKSMSLERKLPLLMTGVTVLVLGAALALTYTALSRSAEATARDRLTTAVQGIAATVENATRDIARRMEEINADPALISALRAGASRPAATVLRRLPGSSDTTLALELWNARDERVARLGREIGEAERASGVGEWLGGASVRDRAADSTIFSPFYEWGGRVHFWVRTPVRERGRSVGYILWQRRAGGPREAIASLRGLIGEQVSLSLRNRDGGFWASAPGTPAEVPQRRDSSGASVYDISPSGQRLIAAEAAIDGTPWIAVLHAPVQSVVARARAAATRLLLLGAVLAGVGAVLSWLISRRITKPIASLTKAAEAIARGERARHVTVSGDDEIGRLAASFNKMSNDIAASHRELEHRVEETLAAAEALAIANERLKRVTEEAEAARHEAERANRAKADFLAVMSHELRTPLNAISGYTELLEIGIYGSLAEPQRDALARIARNQSHLLALINDVLSFAKIDAGQVRYNIQELRVDDALSAVEPLISPLLRSRGVEFTLDICDPAVTVLADRDKLQQVLLNLLTNAIKFTGTQGRVTLQCDARPESVHIHVVDTGVGIPPEWLPDIFDPFVQGDRSLNRPHEGVGLGLAICRDLARGMGGDVSAESEVGRGSRFTVTLPRGARGAASLAASQSKSARQMA